MKIPEDYIEFLYWFKRETENFWENLPKSKLGIMKIMIGLLEQNGLV